MELVINGENKSVTDSISVTTLLKEQNIKMPEMVSVEVNGDILDREQFESTTLKTNDKVEFLYFMGFSHKTKRFFFPADTFSLRLVFASWKK